MCLRGTAFSSGVINLHIGASATLSAFYPLRGFGSFGLHAAQQVRAAAKRREFCHEAVHAGDPFLVIKQAAGVS